MPNIEKNMKIYDLVRAHYHTESLEEAIQKVLSASGEIGATEEQVAALFAFLGLACDLRSNVAKKLDLEMRS